MLHHRSQQLKYLQRQSSVLFSLSCNRGYDYSSSLYGGMTTRSFVAASASSKSPSYSKSTVKGGDAGRVVIHQSSGGAGSGKLKQPRLCAGCGTEVRRHATGSDEKAAFLTGADALLEGVSKKKAKLTRFVDAVESTPVSRKTGVSQGVFLCDRCRALQGDNVWKAYDALKDVSPEIFTSQLKHIVGRRQFGLCICVVDSTDAEHSAMKNLRRSIGKTPCLLVLNKIDLVPRMIYHDVRVLEHRIHTIVGAKFLKTFAVSAITGQGVVELAEHLLENLRGRDVFVVGAANVGKSTLVQRLAKCIADAVDLKGRQAKRRRTVANNLAVTESHLPGTTLQAIRIPCFSSHRHALWDTPGIINAKAVNYSLFPVHLMEPLARPEKIPLPSHQDGTMVNVRPGQSIIIEAAWMTEKQDDDNEQDTKLDSNDANELLNRKQTISTTITSCVLGRIDVLDIAAADRMDGSDKRTASSRYAGGSVFAQAYIHASLKLRVIPTNTAPDHATIPASYVQIVQERMRRATGGQSFNSSPSALHDAYSIPLKPHVGSRDLFQGQVVPGEKEYSDYSAKYCMDIVFASLGWISFTNETKFILVPHCVQGSVFSKRPSLYPTNLPFSLRAAMENGEDQSHYGAAEEVEVESEEEIHQRLRDASRRGRHGANDAGGDGRYLRHDVSRGDGHETGGFDEDEWY